MNKFNFNSQVCTDREQSERLLALGLKPETADCHWANFALFEDYEVFVIHAGNPDDEDDIPAWSLHRLIELIWGDGEHDMSLETHRPFEDCIERIDYMINQSHCFNKEYLEDGKE